MDSGCQRRTQECGERAWGSDPGRGRLLIAEDRESISTAVAGGCSTTMTCQLRAGRQGVLDSELLMGSAQGCEN